MSDGLKQRLDNIINNEKIVLFMKGDRNEPQCGFSARVIGILEELADNYKTVDVLSDPEIRNGIKEYSEWPTIPQLYIEGDFIGGCDVIEQLSKTGDLVKLIGEREPLSAPTIVITDAAAESIREVCSQHPDLNVHLNITDDWVHEFNLSPNSSQVIAVENNGIELLLNRSTAKKIDGLRIDMEVTPEGSVFSITNPNAPPMVSQMSVHELKKLQDSDDTFYLFDVREQS
jgi:monothiol glutaredoxin